MVNVVIKNIHEKTTNDGERSSEEFGVKRVEPLRGPERFLDSLSDSLRES